MIRILAAIVLFNPNIKQLKYCTKNIIPYVDFTLLIDNASKNIDEIKNFASNIPNVSIKRNNENLGLAKPFNELIQYARTNNFSHLLLLDQDSEPSNDFITEYKKYINDSLVCIVPRIIHKSKAYQDSVGVKVNGPSEYVNESINSGTLINITKLPLNISFNEKYFVDWIDIDFFHQLKKLNKKILRANKAILLVDIGHQELHHIFKYKWFSSGYSAFRLRKQAQDTVHFFFENQDYELLKGDITFILWKWFMMLLFEKNRIKKSFAIIAGLTQGLKQHYFQKN